MLAFLKNTWKCTYINEIIEGISDIIQKIFSFTIFIEIYAPWLTMYLIFSLRLHLQNAL